MITLLQIKKLDSKVQSAVELISSLKGENSILNEKLEEYKTRIDELEILISGFKNDQGEIEEGILNALSQLDKIEDTISSSAKESSAIPPPEEAEKESGNTNISTKDGSLEDDTETPENDVASTAEQDIPSETDTTTEGELTEPDGTVAAAESGEELDIF